MRQEGDGGGHMAGWLGLPTAIGSPGLPIISTIYIYTHVCVTKYLQVTRHKPKEKRDY
jgi:hypothetical protein